MKSDLGNKEIFAQNLNRYLRLSGKTQSEVARAVGITRGTFCDWVKGRAYPRMDKVQLLAEYFGVRKSDLVEDVNITKEATSNKVEQIIDLFHRVPEEKQEALLSIIQSVIDNL